MTSDASPAETAERPSAPAAGDVAPEFALTSLDGELVELASVRAARPVALMFGSFS